MIDNKEQNLMEFRPNTPMELFQLLGMIETVTAVPTGSPRNFYEQFKLYVDDLTTPTSIKLYVYLKKLNAWKSVDLS